MSLVAVRRRHLRGAPGIALLVRRAGRPRRPSSGWSASCWPLVAAPRHRPEPEAWSIGGAVVATTAYLRLFLVLGSVVGLVLAIVGTGRPARDATRRPSPSASSAPAALTLALVDPRARRAGRDGRRPVRRPAHARPGRRPGGGDRRHPRARGRVVVAGALAIAATAWIGRDLSQLAAQPVVFGLAYLAFALAVAMRFGAIPFHLWAARLTDAVPETALPILTACAPASLAVVALAWIDASVAPLLVDLDAERSIVLAHRHRLDRPGRGRGLRPGRPRARARLLDHRRRRRHHARPRGARPRRAGRPPGPGSSPSSSPGARSRPGPPAIRAGFWTGRVADLRGWARPLAAPGVAFGLIVLAEHRVPGARRVRRPDALVDLAARRARSRRSCCSRRSRRSPTTGGCWSIGLAARPGRRARSTRGGRSSTPLDVTAIRPGWRTIVERRTGRSRRRCSRSLLAVLALATAAGAFGGPAAAAGGRARRVERPSEIASSRHPRARRAVGREPVAASPSDGVGPAIRRRPIRDARGPRS